MTDLVSARRSDETDISSPPVIAISALCIGYEKHVLLENADLCLHEGKLAVLMGANGHGKTTFLHTILGLHPLMSGSVSILGRAAHLGQDGIGYLPQGRRVPVPQITALDYVTSAWRGGRLGPLNFSATCRKDVARALELVGAAGFAHRPMGLLSGGEKQRVFLAVALLAHPKILILDEPMTSVDAEGQQQIASLLARLCRDLRLTILVSTHHLDPFRHTPHLALRLTHCRLEKSDV
ncbi:ATP-binding cassette domain-containing protein [Candidatus Kirkpatrickella diaphorinae]|uniref:ATP-binding cassette domain-containing protein n=1 Tax=Candidatus Kirkpatrickella diaphorinae TaxID=2984322 RepID=A0ABY6GK14_9PROT|nr:ATP-binding cassette domain-containing protein [Candidatus Kirkpatrickella diaphorinae]UYH51001.1 ATP-binding cassette domain-containing protein [Candidatus Kirkpatrickella diaphorinae]